MAKKKVRRQKSIDIEIGYSDLTYNIIYFPKEDRSFFQGYKVPSVFETNIGPLEVHPTSAPEGTRVGNPNAGFYLVGNLGEWYEHNRVDVGDRVRVTELQRHRRYRLRKLKN